MRLDKGNHLVTMTNTEREDNIMSHVIGYVFDSNDQYEDKWWFDDTIDNYAQFIYMNRAYNVMITDAADIMICTGMYGYIDQLNSQYQHILPELRDVITAYQFGDKTPTLKFVNAGYRLMVQSGMSLL